MTSICLICGENYVESHWEICEKCSLKWPCSYPECENPPQFVCEECDDLWCSNHIAETRGTLLCDYCREAMYYDAYDEFVEEDFLITATNTETKVELPLEFDATLPLAELDKVVGSVTFSREAWDFIRALHDRFQNDEFGVYLYGKRLGNNAEFFVDKTYVPKQKVDATGVDFEEPPPPSYEGAAFLGTYHSHNRMKVFASETDDAYLLSQFTLNVIGNNAGEAIGFVSGDYELFGKNYRVAARVYVTVEKADVPQEVLAKIARRGGTFSTLATAAKKNVKSKK